MNWIGVPTAPDAAAGAVTTGARSPDLIVIGSVALPLRVLDAMKVTL